MTIDSCPLQQVTKHAGSLEKSKEDLEQCSVCLRVFHGRVVDNSVVVTTWCGHKFDTICLKPWLGEGERSCPVCRSELGTMEEIRGDIELYQQIMKALENRQIIVVEKLFRDNSESIWPKAHQGLFNRVLVQAMEMAIVSENLDIAIVLQRLGVKTGNSGNDQAILDQLQETAILDENLDMAINLQKLGAKTKKSESVQAILDQQQEKAIEDDVLLLAIELKKLGAKNNERAQAMLNQALVEAILRGQSSRKLQLEELGAELTPYAVDQAIILAIKYSQMSDLRELLEMVKAITPTVQAVLNQALKDVLAQNQIVYANQLREHGAVISPDELNQLFIQAVNEDNTDRIINILKFAEVEIVNETRDVIKNAWDRAKDANNRFLEYYYAGLLKKQVVC